MFEDHRESPDRAAMAKRDESKDPPLVAAKRFAPLTESSAGAISCLDFDDEGVYLLTASEQAKECVVWDCMEGVSKRRVFFKKIGIGQARFAHRHTGIVHSPTGSDNHIRYLSTHDNKYIRSFQGHTNR